jgi:hypothetical protein
VIRPPFRRAVRVAAGALVALGIAAPGVTRAADADPSGEARRWLERMAAALHPGDAMAARALLFTRDAEGQEETLILDWLRRTQDGEQALALEVIRPEAMEGTVHQLVFPGGGAVDRRVWTPTRGRLNRMRGGHPTDPFLGSFFTYEDLGFALLAGGGASGVRYFDESGRERVEVRSGPYFIYGRMQAVIDVETGLPVRVLFHDRADFPFRRLRFSDVREVGGHLLPLRIEAEDLLSGMRSRLEFDGVRFDVRPDPALFEPDFAGRPLRRGTRIDVPVPGDGAGDGS